MERNKMIISITVAAVAFILIVIGSYFLTSKLSSIYMAILLIIVELIIMSMFNWKFFKLNDAPMGFDKILNCIPFINYSVSMRPVMSWITIASEIISVLLFCVSFFPSIIKLFGEFVLLQAPEYLPLIQVLDLFVLNVIIGIGLIPVVRDVNNLYSNTIGKVTRGKSNKKMSVIATLVSYVPVLETLMLMFPFVRCISLYQCLEKMQTMDKLKIHFD